MIKMIERCSAILLVLFFTGNVAFATNTKANLVVGGTPHQALFDIDIEGDKGFAVGSGGQIFRTDDGGKNWILESNDNSLSLLGVSFSASRAIAVGQFGVIVLRENDGTWRKVESGTSERIFNVDINNSGYAVAVGAFGLILRSTDNGLSWARVSPDWSNTFHDPDMRLGGFFEPNLYGVKINESGRSWIVGELALVLASNDSGLTWAVNHAGGSSDVEVSPTLSAIDVRDDGTAFAVGQEGYILKSNDLGDTWNKLSSVTHQNLLGVTSLASGLVVAPGMREILLSFNDGETWTSAEGLDIKTGWYGSAAASEDGSSAIVVGNNANIIEINYKN
ncbi:Ycf48-like protein [Zhongshania aliphaticivorans]|uniref:Ycf48-like protein n=1 Tax=Zhongshania aliphaticivorans TaxID=1470434 RepID=A0A5S9PZ79_9GAMM|nr:YCF48-related protein [Zhongshania aliphaticivorans]CAA0092505.1 Ycf48-like protein [Zhongshania aliphaticivorans]CAA0109793.1 Ycf48-like protein [Zhongshania aliphaticivorans]